MFCSNCGEKLVENALFCSICGNKVAMKDEPLVLVENTSIEKRDTKKLKEYLNNAKILEVNRYALLTTFDKIEDKINELGHSKSYVCKKVSKSDFKEYVRKFSIVLILITVVINIFILAFASRFLMTPVSMIFTLLIIIIISFLGSGIMLALKNKSYKKEYNYLIEEDIKRVNREKEQIKSLTAQQSECMEKVKTIAGTLEKLYSLDVIYPKYREMLPVITMHEYLESGRCTELVGSDGAYNLFESESRQDIIISSLDRVVSMLEQIRNNQYALYSAIEESNAIAEGMCYEMERLAISNETIANNSKTAAFNAKVVAENSSISAYIDVFKL